MGYMDFDGARYWDIREINKYWLPIKAKKYLTLPSDATKRTDSVTLRSGDVVAAQF